jgi:3D-(3,5/4)-trihydroxycyclohexane-1,2-dione acylhydrolase (decyclizing)
MGSVGVTGTSAANALAAEADVILAVGTRLQDFTTGSWALFRDPARRIVMLNVQSYDAAKHLAQPLVADAQAGLEMLSQALGSYRAPEAWRSQARSGKEAWTSAAASVTAASNAERPTDAQVIGAVQRASVPTDTVVCAAGGLPGELHKLWNAAQPGGYHLEYGYSCMGYEIPGGIGVKMAQPEREIIVLVGDGSYLMMAQELVTAVAEGVKLIVVLVQNHGFASIGALSESLGSQRFGTRYRFRTDSGLDGDKLPVDLAANAASLGAQVIRVSGVSELEKALAEAQAADVTTVVHVETDPLVPAPDSPAWWDVPVAEVSSLSSTQEARTTYERHKQSQRTHLTPSDAEKK